jgi:hypothetical protein
VTWKRGESGNPGGKSPDRAIVTDQLRLVVNEIDPATGIRKARVLATKLVDFAMAGESWAFAQVMDRLEGKPIQETNVNVTRRLADELTDDELAQRIADITGRARATSTIEGSCEEAADPQESDGVVPLLRRGG